MDHFYAREQTGFGEVLPLFTHQLGWEVRLLVGSQLEVVQTQVCRDQEEVLRTREQWKAAMIEKGWS